MQLDLGNNIRQLRRRDKKTQEALADALGVTSQAVSRWESGGSYPDMNLIPSIANFFGVSIDELFGYTNQREQRIDELANQIREMLWQNIDADRSITECIAMARDALVEFPGNEKLMLCLASVLYKAGGVRYGEEYLTDEDGYSVYNVQKHLAYAEWREAIPLFEKALETLPVGNLRDTAMQELSQLYLLMGEYEKGSALVERAPSLWNSREFLRAWALDGKRGLQAFSETLLDTIRACAVLIQNIAFCDQRHLSAAQKADCLHRAISLFDLVCPDGNYGTHHAYVASLQMFQSLYEWLDGKKDAAFALLDEALENAKKMEEVCENVTVHYSAPLVRLAVEKAPCTAAEARADRLTMPEDWPWWNVPEVEQVKKEMQQDPRWDIWAAKTQV